MWRRKIVIRVTLFVFFGELSLNRISYSWAQKPSQIEFSVYLIEVRTFLWYQTWSMRRLETNHRVLSAHALSHWSDIIWRCAHPADDDDAVPCGYIHTNGKTKEKNVLCSILCCRVEFTLSGIEFFILLCGYSRLCAASALFWAFHPALRLTFSHFWSRLGSDSLHKFVCGARIVGDRWWI